MFFSGRLKGGQKKWRLAFLSPPTILKRIFELKNSEFCREIKFLKSLHFYSEKLRILFNASQIKFFDNWKNSQTAPVIHSMLQNTNTTVCGTGFSAGYYFVSGIMAVIIIHQKGISTFSGQSMQSNNITFPTDLKLFSGMRR